MTELVRLLSGYYRVRIRGAAPELVLYRLTQARIPFWDIRRMDDFASDISIRRKDWAQVQSITERIQEGAELLGEHGLLCHFRGLKKRKLFVLAVALCLALAYLLPHFIWCLRVEGNENVPSEQILRELREVGVGFGTWGSSIRPQNVKDQMLARIPELEWLTVNHTGGLATVLVRERESGGRITDRRQVTNLVAERDSIITHVEVYSGQSMCEAGQSVRAGQLLVSGYTDWGHCIEATMALGEIYGRTWRRQHAVTPVEWEAKTEPERVHRRYALLLGRRRINFFKSSGFCGMECDKMSEYHTLTLPGGHSFPIALIVETETERGLTSCELSRQEAEAMLVKGAEEAVQADMVAGEVLQESLKTTRRSAVYELTGSLECHEMVARTAPAIQTESEEKE